MKKATICILAHNNEATISEAIESALAQTYGKKEIVVMEDGSSDNTLKVAKRYNVIINSIKKDIGMISNMNRCFNLSTDYLIFLCADDIFIEPNYVEDCVKKFNENKDIGIIGRYYYQFYNFNTSPIRCWRSDNILQISDNPSGMAFRLKHKGKKYRPYKKAVNKYFTETVDLVKQFLDLGFESYIFPYDAVGIRVWKSNALRPKSFYEYSPIESWVEVVGPQDFVLTHYWGLIQIKCGAGNKYALREIKTFIKYRKRNLLNPLFWLISIFVLVFPSNIIINMNKWYKKNILSKQCKIIKR